jgi:hypothetical protein
MDTSDQINTPQSRTQAVDHINALDVSDSWKKTFKLIEKAEPTGFLKFKKADQLSFSERSKMLRNFKAFFFGGFYYLAKKMYKKGLIILGAACLYTTILIAVERSFSITLPAVVYYIPVSAISSMLANYDYYQKTVKNKHMWENMEIFNNRYVCAAFAISALALSIYSF